MMKALKSRWQGLKVGGDLIPRADQIQGLGAPDHAWLLLELTARSQGLRVMPTKAVKASVRVEFYAYSRFQSVAINDIPIGGGHDMFTLMLVGSGVALAGINWYKHARQNKPLWLLQDAYRGVQAQVERGAQIEAWLESDEGRAEDLAELSQKEAQFNRQASAIVLTVTTAALHIFSRAPILSATGLGVLNGLGALVLLTAHLTVPQRESYLRFTRSAIMGYAGFTSIGYFVLKGAQGLTDPLGIATQLVDFALIGVLWDAHRAARGQVNRSAPVSPMVSPAENETISGSNGL